MKEKFLYGALNNLMCLLDPLQFTFSCDWSSTINQTRQLCLIILFAVFISSRSWWKYWQQSWPPCDDGVQYIGFGVRDLCRFSLFFFQRCICDWEGGCFWPRRADWTQAGVPSKACASGHQPAADRSLHRLLHHLGDDEERPRAQGTSNWMRKSIKVPCGWHMLLAAGYGHTF